ncbi:hypothetical protein [Herbaspirillum aquaticum]|uniref:hypothetical protein n=1 Tax=Herbaspirillum aquaticum TaxID=568783 RepID=UPI001130D2C1|nr:hypothetical protein [Herbaspirillum aquaticum]
MEEIGVEAGKRALIQVLGKYLPKVLMGAEEGVLKRSAAGNLDSPKISTDSSAVGKSGVDSVTGASANSSVPTSNRLTQLQINKENGAAFEKSVFQDVQMQMPDAVQQVTVKTKSGVNTRIDIIGTSPSGQVVCLECKGSASAPLTPNQTVGFPEIKKTGAVVVGNGKPGFPGGTVIPPTDVQIVRPGQKPTIGP